MQYSIINCSHCAILYIAGLTYNWRFVSFDPFCPSLPASCGNHRLLIFNNQVITVRIKGLKCFHLNIILYFKLDLGHVVHPFTGVY